MEIEKCKEGRRSGYRAGKNGRCFIYNAKNDKSKRMALARAQKELSNKQE